MKLIPKGKGIGILVIIIFAVIFLSIFAIDWFDKNIFNPRIWKDWTCDQMEKFAIKFEDEKLTDFQRAKFHEDLSLCMGS